MFWTPVWLLGPLELLIKQQCHSEFPWEPANSCCLHRRVLTSISSLFSSVGVYSHHSSVAFSVLYGYRNRGWKYRKRLERAGEIIQSHLRLEARPESTWSGHFQSHFENLQNGNSSASSGNPRTSCQTCPVIQTAVINLSVVSFPFRKQVWPKWP